MAIVCPGFGHCFHRMWNKARAWLLLPVGNILNTTNYCWLLNQSRQSGTVKYREVCGQTGRAPATSARRFSWASSGDLLYWVCVGRWREAYGGWFSPPSGWSGYKSCFVFGFELPLGDQLYEATFFLIFLWYSSRTLSCRVTNLLPTVVLPFDIRSNLTQWVNCCWITCSTHIIWNCKCFFFFLMKR